MAFKGKVLAPGGRDLSRFLGLSRFRVGPMIRNSYIECLPNQANYLNKITSSHLCIDKEKFLALGWRLGLLLSKFKSNLYFDGAFCLCSMCIVSFPLTLQS